MNGRAWEVMILSGFFLALGFMAQKPAEDSTPSIGISVGEKMPAFTAFDQFGHEVSSDKLKGPNGTVLVFFRSADW